jgi:multidrug efflux pump subunit AcrA (membrane-fusion protein)
MIEPFEGLTSDTLRTTGPSHDSPLNILLPDLDTGADSGADSGVDSGIDESVVQVEPVDSPVDGPVLSPVEEDDPLDRLRMSRAGTGVTNHASSSDEQVALATETRPDPITLPVGVPPSPVHRERPRTAATRLGAGLLALLVLIAVGVTALLLRSGPGTTGAGYLEPTSSAYLNFSQSGSVTSVLVKPGDQVRVGEVLAEQTDTDLEAKLAADQATLYADQAHALELSGASVTQIHTLITQADQQLTTAQTTASGSLATFQARAASAKAALATAQSALATAQQQYADALSSCDAPDRTATSQPSDVQCAQIRTTLSDDTSAVNNSSAALSQAQLALQNAQTSASQQLALANSQAALAAATQNQPSTSTAATGSASDVAAANAAVSRDIAAVAADQAQIAGTTIVSPVDGVVGSVGAQAGDYASPDGVHTFNDASGSSSSSSQSGFQLFSAPTPSNSGSSGGSGEQPVAIVYSTTMRVTAQVSEHTVTKVHVGEKATVTLPALEGGRLTAIVADVDPTAVTRAGKVYYLVDLTLANPSPAGAMPGMTADVHFG